MLALALAPPMCCVFDAQLARFGIEDSSCCSTPSVTDPMTLTQPWTRLEHIRWRSYTASCQQHRFEHPTQHLRTRAFGSGKRAASSIASSIHRNTCRLVPSAQERELQTASITARPIIVPVTALSPRGAGKRCHGVSVLQYSRVGQSRCAAGLCLSSRAHTQEPAI